MDERMSAARWGVACAIAVAWPAAGYVQELTDPTRPPSAAAVAGAAAEAPPQGPRLESVLLSPGRKLAVIDGTVVALGGKFGQATLVRVTETEVVLKSGEETQVLKLYPAIDKTAVRSRARAKGGKR